MSDLTRSPWLRAALLIGAVGLAGYGLVSQWPQVRAALVRLHGWDVAGAEVPCANASRAFCEAVASRYGMTSASAAPNNPGISSAGT